MGPPINKSSIKDTLNDIRKGDVIFFIGSNFLRPPRTAYIERIMEFVETEKSINKARDNLGIGFRVITWGRREYSELDRYLSEIWPIICYRDLQMLIRKIKKIKFFVTTIFDSNIEKSLDQYENIFTLTGIESIIEDKETQIKQSDLTLYQLLGNTTIPDTLCIDRRRMYDLREKCKDSSNFRNLILSIFQDKTLIALGYENRDLYDDFFREIINDFYSNYEKPLLKNIYFVDKPDYRSYYGIWEDKDERKLNVIPIQPTDFIHELVGEFSGE